VIAVARYEVWGRKTYVAPELPDYAGTSGEADTSDPVPDDPTVLPVEPEFLRLTTTDELHADLFPLDLGASYTIRVRGISADGIAGDFSDDQDIVLNAVLPVMAAPTTPTVTSDLGVISVAWDGLMADGTPPVQFSGVFAQISDVVDGVYVAAGQNLLIDGASVIGGKDIGSTYYVRLVGIDRLNQLTAPSTAVSVLVVGVDLGDLESDVANAITAAQAAGEAGQSAAEAAQTAANSADAKAAQALLDAADAETAANNAVAAANGKNRIIFSAADASGTSDASGVPYVAGDVWFKKAGSLIVAQWEFVAGAWATRTLDSAVIANLNAGKINAGTLDVARLNGADVRAAILTAGKITAADMVAGTITATSGIIATAAINNAQIATLDAAKINTGTLSADRLNAADVRAKVIAAGKITANDIDAGSLTAAIVTSTSVSGVTITGTTVQTAAAANTGIKFTSAGIFGYDSMGTQQFKLDAVTGALTASSGTFTGTVNATSGTISGALTVSGSLTGGKYLSAASGRRVEISGSSAKFYENGTSGEFGSEAKIYGYSPSPNTGNGQLVIEAGIASVRVGKTNMASGGQSYFSTEGADIDELWVSKLHDTSDTGWINVTYLNGCTTQGDIPVSVRRIGNRVFMRGLVTKSGGFPVGITVIGRLPAGFASVDGWLYLPSVGASATAPVTVTILDTGDIRVTPGAAMSWVSTSVTPWFV
jgi:hypothetical protein